MHATITHLKQLKYALVELGYITKLAKKLKKINKVCPKPASEIVCPLTTKFEWGCRQWFLIHRAWASHVLYFCVVCKEFKQIYWN